MGKVLEKKEVREALARAKKLEKQSIASSKKQAERTDKGARIAERLKRLLKKSWFIRDVDGHDPREEIERRRPSRRKK